MKKTMLLLLGCLYTVAAWAQTNKGAVKTYYLGISADTLKPELVMTGDCYSCAEAKAVYLNNPTLKGKRLRRVFIMTGEAGRSRGVTLRLHKGIVLEGTPLSGEELAVIPVKKVSQGWLVADLSAKNLKLASTGLFAGIERGPKNPTTACDAKRGCLPGYRFYYTRQQGVKAFQYTVGKFSSTVNDEPPVGDGVVAPVIYFELTDE